MDGFCSGKSPSRTGWCLGLPAWFRKPPYVFLVSTLQFAKGLRLRLGLQFLMLCHGAAHLLSVLRVGMVNMCKHERMTLQVPIKMVFPSITLVLLYKNAFGYLQGKGDGIPQDCNLKCLNRENEKTWILTPQRPCQTHTQFKKHQNNNEKYVSDLWAEPTHANRLNKCTAFGRPS